MTRLVGGSKIHSNWSASGGQLVFSRDNASVGVTWGEDDKGFDTTWYGETSGAYMKWVASADELLFTNAEVRMPSVSITAAVITTASIGNLNCASIITDTILSDGVDIAMASGSGSKIATASTQKMAFYGATPITQPLKTSYASFASLGDVVGALVALGLFNAS